MVGAPLSSQWIAQKAASFTGCKLILSLSLFQNCTKHLISLPSTHWGQNWCWVCSGATGTCRPFRSTVLTILGCGECHQQPLAWKGFPSGQGQKWPRVTNQPTNQQPTTASDLFGLCVGLCKSARCCPYGACCIAAYAPHICASLLLNSLLTDLWISIRLMSLY